MDETRNGTQVATSNIPSSSARTRSPSPTRPPVAEQPTSSQSFYDFVVEGADIEDRQNIKGWFHRPTLRNDPFLDKEFTKPSARHSRERPEALRLGEMLRSAEEYYGRGGWTFSKWTTLLLTIIFNAPASFVCTALNVVS